MTDEQSRRSFLKWTGPAGLMMGLPVAGTEFPASAQTPQEVTAGGSPDTKPKYSIKFAVIGLDHNHINGITDAVRRGGGELVSVYSNLPKELADFKRRYPNIKVAANEDEILNDPQIQLVCSASIPHLRAP